MFLQMKKVLNISTNNVQISSIISSNYVQLTSIGHTKSCPPNLCRNAVMYVVMEYISRSYCSHCSFQPAVMKRLYTRLFPIWRNSVQIATLQMIGYVLLSTNFNTLQSHLQDLITQRLRLQIPADLRDFFNF